MTAKRQSAPRRREDDLAALIAACGRDERVALQALYELSAAKLYSVALKGGTDRNAADQALVQTYLAIFTEAGSFERDRDDALAWLLAVLARHLPGLAKLTRTNAIKPVEPPAEVWQKLDIALGLKRLDRHIKPGVATQARGRDPMPNAHDRRIERQLRFWRVTSVASLIVGVAAIALILALGLQGGPPGLLAQPAVSPTQPAASPIAAVIPATSPSPEPSIESASGEPVQPAATAGGDASWLAILQPAAGSRVWRVEHHAGGLSVTAMPPFALPTASDVLADEPDDAASSQILVLWAVTGASGSVRHLGTLDPASTTRLAMPEALDGPTLELVVSLEPAHRVPGEAPSGPLLFAGGRAP